MRKIGNISSAIGLMFLGVWMIIYMNNKELGVEVFKWWPVIIIILGVEILMYLNRRVEGERTRVNYFIVIVILMFFATNVYVSVRHRFGNFLYKVEKKIDLNGANFSIDFDNDLEKVKIQKNLQSFGNQVVLNIPNGDIKIKRSQGKEISIEGEVHVKKNAKIEQYDIKAEQQSNGYEIRFREEYVRGVKATIYLPENYNLRVEGDNVQVKTEDKEVKSNIDINANNGNITLDGDIQQSKIDVVNANINIKNKLTKDISIDITNGKVDIDTEDENIDVNVDINAGVCSVNKERAINSGISTKLGTGEGKIKVKVNNGVVNVDSQE